MLNYHCLLKVNLKFEITNNKQILNYKLESIKQIQIVTINMALFRFILILRQTQYRF